MSEREQTEFIIDPDDLILVTGSNGFIGPKVVQSLLAYGFRNIRCFARPSAKTSKVAALCQRTDAARLRVFQGNLLSKEDCLAATKDAAVVIHLAAGRGEKSFPDAFMNSVVTTRNLLEACLQHQCLKRFVNVSSFAVYSNIGKTSNLLDETCLTEEHPEVRGEAYSFAKAKQDEIVAQYGKEHGIPFVTIRPGVVYGPGNLAITGRVGIGTFGVFLHLGGSNRIPFTYVDNCAEAIALAGLRPGINGEVFNVVDDDLPSSRQFLRLYKRSVKPFRSLYLPKTASYMLCYLWERYSRWSYGQLPSAFNRSRWNSLWRKTEFSNNKLKSRLGWRPGVSTHEGLQRYFEACRAGEIHA
ncbi:MAG: NAD(P)-dependent oxidoreductase [Terracidiphilus sp.]